MAKYIKQSGAARLARRSLATRAPAHFYVCKQLALFRLRPSREGGHRCWWPDIPSPHSPGATFLGSFLLAVRCAPRPKLRLRVARSPATTECTSILPTRQPSAKPENCWPSLAAALVTSFGEARQRRASQLQAGPKDGPLQDPKEDDGATAYSTFCALPLCSAKRD